MFAAQPPEEKELLKEVLAPLLDDFMYWFARSLTALERGQLSFMSAADQADLMARIRVAQAEVEAAKSLFDAMDGNMGLEMEALMPWNRLVSECWKVAQTRRQLESES